MVLECLAREPELGITELSEQVGLGKSTIHRIVLTLKNANIIEQSISGKYRLGIRLFELGNIVVTRLGLRKEAHPFLNKLAELSSETVNLAILDQYSVVHIDRVESSESLRTGMNIGQRSPAFCLGIGKVLLANLPSQELQAMLHDPSFKKTIYKYTKNTITDIEQLYNNLMQIKQEMYAVDNEEFNIGVRCIGAPVFNYTNNVVAAISIAGPTVRMTLDRIKDLIPHVMSAAEGISRSLGYEGSYQR